MFFIHHVSATSSPPPSANSAAQMMMPSVRGTVSFADEIVALFDRQK